MTSLTQFDLSYVEEFPSDINQTIVAYHRLHQVTAVYLLAHEQFDFYECKSIYELKWQKLGSWKATNNEFKSLIGVIALEAYDLFAFIGSNPSNSGTEIIFISFDGKIRLKQTVSLRKDTSCVDYNQKTREFFIGFENGSLMCLFTNCNNKYEYSLTVKRIIKVQAENRFQTPKQIVTQDFIGLIYVLTVEGDILCIDGTKFDLIYGISRNAFSMIPSRIYCDKFGTDFLIHLHNSERTKEQLECWHPPEDYASCRAGRFERFLIPLSASIVKISFESVGLYSGRTLLKLFTNNKKLQLWSCLGSTSVNLEAEITLNIPSATWRQYQTLFSSDAPLQSSTEANGGGPSASVTKDAFFPRIDEYHVIGAFITSTPNHVKFSSIFLMNICQLITAVGIQLPEKKDQQLSMQYLDLEITRHNMDSDFNDPQFQERNQSIHRQFASNSDDESSIMSETLIGALSSLAEANRSIDEKISQSSMSTLQLTHDNSADYNNLTEEGKNVALRGDAYAISVPSSSRDQLQSLSHQNTQGAVPPTRPSLIRVLTSKPTGLSELAYTELPLNTAKPPSFNELMIIKFFPNYFLQNQDTSKSTIYNTSPTAATRIVQPYGMLLNDHFELLAFTHDGLKSLTLDVLMKKISIDYHAVAYRLGLMTVVNAFKECLVCDIKNIHHSQGLAASSSTPLRVALTIKNHVKITAVNSADIYLKTPLLPSLSNNNKKKSEKSTTVATMNKDQNKITEPTMSKFLVIALGDSEGFVHVYICDSNQIVLQSESFQAHQSVSVKQIIFTADASRPLWQVGIDYLQGSNKIGLQTLAGSSIITASVEGEIKVWHPYSIELAGAKTAGSFEKFFQFHQIRWKLAGVFVIDRSYTIPVGKILNTNSKPSTADGKDNKTGSKPSTAPSVTTVKKLREMISIQLAPGCLNLLVTFTNGCIEEWSIPGLLDTSEPSIATSQKEIWSNNQLHREEINTLRVFVHGPLSTIKQVYFLHDHERDSILAKLSSYIRVPNRMKTTAGLSFQEMKLLASSSSLTTCSKDNTLVLWGFQSLFLGHCSYLIPVPVKKFYFSSIPSNGLCYPLNIISGHPHTGNAHWKVDAIINGRLQTVVMGAHDALFSNQSSTQPQQVGNSHQNGSIMMTDNRSDIVILPSTSKNAFINFEDDFFSMSDKNFNNNNNARRGSASDDWIDNVFEKKSKIVMALPVITPVFKAQYLVNGYHLYNATFNAMNARIMNDPDEDSKHFIGKIPGSTLLSSNLLEEWVKVEPVSKDPIVSTVQLTDRPSTAIRSSLRELDIRDIPEYVDTSKKNYEDFIADISSRSSSRGGSAIQHKRSLSPVILRVPLPEDVLEYHEEEKISNEDAYGSTKNRIPSARKKLSVNGIMMEVNVDVSVKELEESLQNQKFIIDKTPQASPRKPLPVIPEPAIASEKKVETEKSAPLVAEINSSPEKSPKPLVNPAPLTIEIAEGEDGNSAVSSRTKLSVSAVSFTKGSRVVRTISFNEDDVIDSLEVENAKPVDETSVSSDVTPEEPKKAHKGPIMTKAVELRQKMQAQLKERMELRDQHGGNIYGGDARQSLKKVYTSKTSIEKKDIQHFQKGSKQPTSAAAAAVLASGRVVLSKGKHQGDKNVVVSEGQNKEHTGEPPTATAAIPTTDFEMEGGTFRRPTSPGRQKFVVIKMKDETSKLTHQLIVAKSKQFRDGASREAPHQQGLFYASDINIGGGGGSSESIEFEDETNSQLDLDSTEFTLSIDTGVKIDQSFTDYNVVQFDENNMDDGLSSPSPRKKTGSPMNGSGKQPTLAELNIPAKSAKPQSIELDLPDLRKEKRRKYALVVSQQAGRRSSEQREAVNAALANAGVFDDNDDASESSIVSHYFDRNVQPIFVEREKPTKQALKRKSRRVLGSTSSAMGRSRDSTDMGDAGEYEDDEDEDPRIQELNAAILDMYLDDLSPEEKKMFENLDEGAKKKLLREIRSQNGTGKRKNNKTKDLFKKLTKMATDQAKLHALLSMDITVESVEVTDEGLTVSVNCNQSGPVMVILAFTKHRFQASKEHFYTIPSIQAVPGYVEHRSVLIQNDNFEEVTFTNLRPDTNYTVFAVIDKTDRSHFPMTDEVNEEEEEQKNALIKSPKSITLKTLEEKLEIEWSRLDLIQRTIELRAAIRSEFVQIKAFFNYPAIALPTDEEILEEHFQQLLSPTISEKDYHEMKQHYFQSNPLLKHIPIFLDWWIGHAKLTSKTRSTFHEIEAYYAILNKKIFKSLKEDHIFNHHKELNALQEYAKISIKNRARLNREIEEEEEYITATATTTTTAIKGGITTSDKEIQQSIDPNDERFALLKRFRSWYKGGYVIKEKEMKLLKLQSANSSSKSLLPTMDNNSEGAENIEELNRALSVSRSRSTDTKDDLSIASEGASPVQQSLNNNNPVGGALAQQRLQERSLFLKSLLHPVDQCIQQIISLFEKYKKVKEMSLRLFDLSSTRRNSISTNDASAIMYAKKFLDLCIQKKMIPPTAYKHEEDPFPDISLETLNPFKHMKRTRSESSISMTPKAGGKVYPKSLVLQRVAGVDLFRPVHINTLKPDEPPPLELKCMPGTNRRPNKPWQSLSRQEQELELTLACALDAIWELAIADGIPIPEPEDRVLSPIQFPMKAFIWENFRKWYAGDEDRDPTPGQGIPTLARVVFSEQLEIPQVENDSFVASLMEEQSFKLPPSYQKKGGLYAMDGKNPEPDQMNSFDLDENEEDKFFEQMNGLSSSPPPPSTQTMRQAYEKAIANPAGASIRNELFMTLLSHYFKSRLMNMMKFLWPPGLKRIGLQYVYPRSLSFYFPKFTLPLYRFHLFPSRSQATYNREEILSWYNAVEIMDDDQAMIRSEKKGVKQRAYHEWLTLEPQRQMYSRSQMAAEDSISYQHRELTLLLEKRWKYQEDRLIQLDEDIDAGEYDPKMRTQSWTSMINLTPRELRLLKTLESAVEEKVAAEAQGEQSEEEEVVQDNRKVVEELKTTDFAIDELLKEEKPHSRRESSRRNSNSGSKFVSPRHKSPRHLSSVTPRSHISYDNSEIGFPPTESTTHQAVGPIPPIIDMFGRDIDRRTEELKGYISQHLTPREQDDLSAALAVYDQTIAGLRTTPINEELVADYINNSISNQMNFRVLGTLPQEYWYIFEESFEFKTGSGIYNDDELEEARLLQEERARKAVEDALEFERVLSVEKKKREQEELARLKREEQDRRLREGLVRRRKIREHLEELKQLRFQRQKEEEEARFKAMEEERLAKLAEEKRIAYENYLQRIENQRLLELQLMEKEEIYMKDLKVRNRELKFMEHEDILSFLNEQIQVQHEMMQEERRKELEMIYTPFEPFQFKQTRLPELHRLLAYGDVDKAEAGAEGGDGEEDDEKSVNSFLSSSVIAEKRRKKAKSLRLLSSPTKDPFVSTYGASEEVRTVTGGPKSPEKGLMASTSFTNYTANSKNKKYKPPIPVSHDPSTISFQSISKKGNNSNGEGSLDGPPPPSMNQKMNHLKNTFVRTSDLHPTKKKIRQFFDITKLSMENLSKPFTQSIPMDNTKDQLVRSQGDLEPIPLQPPSRSKSKIELTKSSSFLPFNPYDTQWELQQSPPLTLSNLPFFVRPSTHGISPFRSHTEQTLSTPQLSLAPPLSSQSRSRPFSATTPHEGRASSSRGRSGSKPSSAGRVLSPIDFKTLQHPFPTMPYEDNLPTVVGTSPSQYQQQRDDQREDMLRPLSTGRGRGKVHSDRPIPDESDLASQQTKQSVETYESEYNKTTEVTVDYINSLLAETGSKAEKPRLAPYTEEEMQYMNSLTSSLSIAASQSASKKPKPNFTEGISVSGSLSVDGIREGMIQLDQTQAPSDEMLVAGGGSLQSSKNTKKSKVKPVVSLANDLIERTNNQKEWLEYLQMQQKLTTASLSTIDSQEKEKLKRILGRGGILPPSAQLANQSIVLPQKNRQAGGGGGRGGKAAADLLSSTMPNLASSPIKNVAGGAGIPGLSTSASTSAIDFHETGLDFKTYHLAKIASEEVIRLKQQRELLKQYITGHAVLEEERNEYYLLACEPGIQNQTILQRNPSIQKFSLNIHEHLQSEQNLVSAGMENTASPTVSAAQRGGAVGGNGGNGDVSGANSLHGSEEDADDDVNSSITGGGGGGGQSITESPRPTMTGGKRRRKMKEKSKSLLLYQAIPPDLTSIPPPALAKKPILSSSTSKLLTQVVPSTLSAQATPLFVNNNKEKTSSVLKKPPLRSGNNPSDPLKLDPVVATSASSNAVATAAAAAAAAISQNPFIMGNRMNIPKETKKDMLAKSKQLLLSTPSAASSSNPSSAKPTPPLSSVKPTPPLSSSNRRQSSSSGAKAVNNPNLKIITEDSIPSSPRSGMFEGSKELISGRSLDLFIRTPRIDGKSLEQNATSDSHDEDGLGGNSPHSRAVIAELERSLSDPDSFNHQVVDDVDDSITSSAKNSLPQH